jgi:S-adenosylmethionine hydrolase
MAPIIALLTDFGTRDHYVGAMKGAILSVAPDARLVDIVHDLPPHDVEAGAFALAAACTAFPQGTVFVAVVDPGVGSTRRGLAATASGYAFVGPDNGVLSLALADDPGARVRALAERRFWRPQVSSTFHGRDVFGPVAAHLALGVPLDDLGPAVADPVRLAIPAVRALGAGEWEATILHVDAFGNLITNVDARTLDAVVRAGGSRAGITVALAGATVPFVARYTDVAAGRPCALLGSSGRLEVAVNRGRASEVLGAGRGDRVRVRRA